MKNKMINVFLSDKRKITWRWKTR